ncbi:MAG: 2-succinyl-6-hydroxy-2,4-cyclohexadiene-1-carboxylate synthase, partial [Candidatus Sericytochromatia bacterium]
MTRERHVTAPRWAWRTWGREGAPRLLLLHGFAGAAAFWAPLADIWAADWHVLAPDLPGHGASEAPQAGYGLAEAAEGLALALTGPTTVVGYSLGGRLAAHLAVAHPERVTRLVLIGASAGLATPAERAARLEADARWAAMLRERGLDAFLDAWEALPLFAGQRTVPTERQDRLRTLRAGLSAEGLAAAMTAFGLGTQDDLRERLAALAVPTWWAAGAKDEKFSTIAREMASAMPDARAVVVPDCGHNVAFERPEAIVELLNHVADTPL